MKKSKKYLFLAIPIILFYLAFNRNHIVVENDVIYSVAHPELRGFFLTLYLPKGATIIGRDAFDGCIYLKNNNISDAITKNIE